MTYLLENIRFHSGMKHLLSALLAALLIMNGCANKKDEVESERELYEEAQKSLENKQYELAIDKLRDIELRYPFGRFAEQAQLEIIYAYYQNDEFIAANISADRFIRQHPEHPSLDYAYYVRALSNYLLDSGASSRFMEKASVKRDLGAPRQSFEDFDALIKRFPDSDYAPDAQKRMLYIRDVIAQQEVEIANYYMQRAAYVAAINRAKTVIEQYPGTSASADALALLVHAYNQTGMTDLAQDSLNVLTHNFPDYEKLREDGTLSTYDKLYHDEVNWLNFVSFGLLNKDEEKIPARKKKQKVEKPTIPAPPSEPEAETD